MFVAYLTIELSQEITLKKSFKTLKKGLHFPITTILWLDLRP